MPTVNIGGTIVSTDFIPGDTVGWVFDKPTSRPCSRGCARARTRLLMRSQHRLPYDRRRLQHLPRGKRHHHRRRRLRTDYWPLANHHRRSSPSTSNRTLARAATPSRRGRAVLSSRQPAPTGALTTPSRRSLAGAVPNAFVLRLLLPTSFCLAALQA
jgi:hypothetical protein